MLLPIVTFYETDFALIVSHNLELRLRGGENE